MMIHPTVKIAQVAAGGDSEATLAKTKVPIAECEACGAAIAVFHEALVVKQLKKPISNYYFDASQERA